MEDRSKYQIKNCKIISDFIVEITFKTEKFKKLILMNIEHKGWWKELEDFKPEHLCYWEEYRKFYLK